MGRQAPAWREPLANEGSGWAERQHRGPGHGSTATGSEYQRDRSQDLPHQADAANAKKPPEIIQHITAGGKILADRMHIEGHNQVL